MAINLTLTVEETVVNLRVNAGGYVPSGGTTGQVLVKASGSDLDTQWATVTGVGGSVDSVNGATGVVVLDTDDIGEGAANLYHTDARVSTNADVGANTTHRSAIDNPHSVTKAQVGLSNVDNTSDANKPVSAAVQTALDGKVDDAQVLTNVPAGAVFTDTVYDDTDVLKDADALSPVTGVNKLITQSDLPAGGGGDMLKSTYDTNDNGIVDNAETVNGLTVEMAVPLGAVFTDTVYDDTAIQSEVDLNTAKVGITPQQAADIVANNAKISATGNELEATDIDTLAELNAVITDATLIDTGDARLSDARPPLAHTHTLLDITDSGTSAALNVPAVGDAAIGEVVKGDDTRLTDSRTPTAHTHVSSEITDFDTEVSNNPSVAANTAKISYTDAAAVAANTAKVSADGSVGTHSDFDLTGIANGDIPTWVAANGRFEPAAPSGGGPATEFFVSPGFKTKTSDSTLALDPDLQFTPELDSLYAVEVTAVIRSDAAADFKYALLSEGGTVYGEYTEILGTSPNVSTAYGFSRSIQTLGFVTEALLHVKGLMFTSVVNPGTFGFAWAQNSSHASNTQLYKGSYMSITKLN